MSKNKQYTIGIDIGGTKMLAILFDGQKVLADYVLATPKDSVEHMMIMINALLEPLFEKAKEDKIKIKGIGLGVAGVLDYKDKKIINSPNIPIIENVNLATQIENYFEIPVKIDNDTNCFLRAEVELGVARKFQNVYGIIIGTGVGGAWYYSGQIYTGSHGGAGEPGAMILNCDQTISLENAYKKLTQSNTRQMADDAYQGDPLSQKTFEEIAELFGITMANIVNILDPEIIVLGGGSIEASDLFLPKAKKIMREHILSPLSKKIKISRSKLGQQAGAIGAALLF